VRRGIASVALLIVVALPAPLASANGITVASATGKISALTRTSLTVRSAGKITCRLRTVSPPALGFGLGSRVRITCVNGTLTKIAGTGTSQHQSSSTGASGTNGTSVAAIVGTIDALSPTSITIAGVSCSIGPTSPNTSGFHVGQRAGATCSNGTLDSIDPST
jgi:hypothetical protein